MSRGLIAFAFVSCAATLGCSELNAPIYFKGQTFFAAGKDDPLPVGGLTLRFRAPTDAEQMKLDADSTARGYDVPWVSRDKVHIEVSYKVTFRCPTPDERSRADDPPTFDCDASMLDGTHAFTLMVDGADQFTKYDTQVVSAALQQAADDPPRFLPLIPVIPRMLAPGESFSGVVREDDFAEGELDLDALGRWLDTDPASPTFAGVLINRSEVAPHTGLGMVPGFDPNNLNPLVVPAMTEVDLRLQTDVPMAIEFFVRVRDDDDRLWHNDSDPMFNPDPTLFQPPATM